MVKIFRGLLDLLYPPRCVFCRRLTGGGGAGVCPECRETLPWTEDGAEKRGEGFTVCVAPLYYRDNVRESLHRYKFGGAEGFAETYGPLLAECIQTKLRGGYDLISWVPLSRKRLRERGYDQAKLLAHAAARALGEPLVPTLEKRKDVAKQSAAGGAEQRRANIAGAYRVPEPETVAGKRVLLIDDIVTTGATLSECARTLRAAGAAAVVCAALASTPGEDLE